MQGQSKKKNKRPRPSRRQAVKQQRQEQSPFNGQKKGQGQGQGQGRPQQQQQGGRPQQQGGRPQQQGGRGRPQQGGRPQQQQQQQQGRKPQQQQQGRKPQQQQQHRPQQGTKRGHEHGHGKNPKKKPKLEMKEHVDDDEDVDVDVDEMEGEEEMDDDMLREAFGMIHEDSSDDDDVDEDDELGLMVGDDDDDVVVEQDDDEDEAEDAKVESYETEPDEQPYDNKIQHTAATGHEIALEKQPNDETARTFFEWLIYPMPISQFYSEYWEKKPLYISRDKLNKQSSSTTPSSSKSSQHAYKHYYDGWFSRSDMDEIMRNKDNPITYGADMDITSYKNYKRETHNPEGKVDADHVWKQVEDGCSVRFLCPQKFSNNVWRMLNLLDEFWGCQAGANTYLTPANTQGFAPHYDDVDIFVLQTEGSKRWRLYEPREPSEVLASVSSRNFDQDEIGEPFMDVVLHAGDFLYAPRGTIHQCVASEKEHSLHITVSTALKNSWADYMMKVLPAAVSLAAAENIEFRKSLPRQYQQFMGMQHSDRDDPRRERFQDHFLHLLERLVTLECVPYDTTADQMAVDFMHARVPPYVVDTIKPRTVYALKEEEKKNENKMNKMVRPTTKVRLVQEGIARICVDADGGICQVYHCGSNSRLYHGNDICCLELPISHAPIVEGILEAYPDYIQVENLPEPMDGEEDEGKVKEVDPLQEERIRDAQHEVVTQLFLAGLIEMKN